MTWLWESARISCREPMNNGRRGHDAPAREEMKPSAGGNALPEDMYAMRGSSVVQRIFLAVSGGSCVALAWCLLFGGGITAIGMWFGWGWRAGDDTRRLCLAFALSIYYVRLLFTQFMFLERAIGWSEACTIATWVFCIYLVFAISGGMNPALPDAAIVAGLALFAFGSWINSYAEYARYVWKQRPENRGKLFTLGLFRYSRHPNYLGDLISFSGLCLISGRLFTIAIPSIMLAGFVFVNIPMLDSHLQEHYGRAFDEYAARTRKLIPFIY